MNGSRSLGKTSRTCLLVLLSRILDLCEIFTIILDLSNLKLTTFKMSDSSDDDDVGELYEDDSFASDDGEEEVLASTDDDDSDEAGEDDDDEALEKGGLQAKSDKFSRFKIERKKDDMASDIEDDGEDGEDEHGMPSSQAWGANKQLFYDTDFVDKDYRSKYLFIKLDLLFRLQFTKPFHPFHL